MGRKRRKKDTLSHHVHDHDIASGKEITSCQGQYNVVTTATTTSDIDNFSNVYNRIIKFGCNESQDGVKNPTPPPSNWLKVIHTLSRTRKASFNTSIPNDSFKVEEEQADKKDNEKCKASSTASLPSPQLVKDEIKQLSNELIAIKHALWPAAVHTSKVKNKRNHKKRKVKHGDLEQKSEHQHQHEQGQPQIERQKHNSTSPSLEYRNAREKSNPFETLGTQKWIEGDTKSFLCRSAMKLANIDALLDFVLTSSKESHVLINDELSKVNTSNNICSTFKFADLCGAPGGFSEYILRRVNDCDCIGYGMSLLGTNDDGNGLNWNMKVLKKLTKMTQAENSFLKKWQVCSGQDGTGDIYNWENVTELQRLIQTSSGSSNNEKEEWKVNLVVADGGFDAQRDSENQESLAHALVASQTAASLLLLKRGGNFVIKMFGFQHSLPLIQHLYHSFEKLVLLKPITSRPASAERYLVCLTYKGLDAAFDILTWRDNIINYREETWKMNDGWMIKNVLDEMDRDMLRLNIQACAGIISSLQKEEQPMHSKKKLGYGDTFDFSYYRKHFKLEF